MDVPPFSPKYPCVENTVPLLVGRAFILCAIMTGNMRWDTVDFRR